MHSVCATLSSVACPYLPSFSTVSHKPHDFSGKKFYDIKCVFWFSPQLWYQTFLVLRIVRRDTINVNSYLSKVPVILVRLNYNFLDRVLTKSLDIKVHQNPSSGGRVVLMWTDGRTDGQTDRQTDMTKLIVAFHSFANASKKTANSM